MATLRSAWTIARRELRGALRPLIVVPLCLAIGVATIATVGVSAESVRETVRRDARALLGGDLELESANIPVPVEELRRLLGSEAQLSTTVRTTTLVVAPNGRRLAVALKAVDKAWPLLGTLELDPPIAIQQALAGDGAVVEPTVLGRLGVRVGDRLQLGETTVTIAAVILREPDRLGGFAGFGPRLLVSWESVERAGLLRPGALLRFEHRAVVPPRTLDPLVERLRSLEPEANWRLRTAGTVEPSIARFSDRFASYLTLAGLASLLVGGLGVALAVSSYLAARRSTIAVLKALGATAAEVDAAYALLLAVVTALGVGLGLVVGHVVPMLIASGLATVLPIAVEVRFHRDPLLLAGAIGVLTAMLSAGWPLARAREVSAASLLRAEVAPIERWPRPGRLLIFAVVATCLATLIIASVDRPILAALFLCGTLMTMALTGGTGRLILDLAAPLVTKAPLAIRLAVRNLGRGASGAIPVLVGLGTGLAALVTVALLEANVARDLETRLAKRAPSHVVIDIQPDQWQPFERLVRETPGAILLQSAPTLRARVTRIKGEPIDRAQIAENVRWTVDRDRGLTWQAVPPPDAELIAGSWWPADYAGPPLVSIEGEVARGYGVEVGDTITFNVLGRTIEARIANIRHEIDWASGRLDFVFILSPGVLDRAPYVRIAALDLDKSIVTTFLERLAREFPNVTPIEIGSIVREVSATLAKIAFAIQIMAGVTLVTGLLVLAAALTAARRRHLQQTILLKILGAPRWQILQIISAELLVLVSLAGLSGVFVGGLAAWSIVRFVLGIAWSFEWGPPLAVFSVITVLALIIGAAMAWRLLGRSTAVALRVA